MAFACSLLLALVVLHRPATEAPSMLVRFLETRPLVWLGIISYSVFLWHEPLVRFLQEHGFTFSGTAGFFANTLLLAGVTLSLSAITYRFVERPALPLKRKKLPETSPADEALAASSLEAAP
jgi:peptidoglycan/LPS O-acetylase OafA/YrhL